MSIFEGKATASASVIAEMEKLQELQQLFMKCGASHRARGDESKHDTAIADTWDVAAVSLADRLSGLLSRLQGETR